MVVLRLLVLIVLLWLAWRLVRRWLLPPAVARKTREGFELVSPCRACGTHVPAAELRDGRCARCR